MLDLRWILANREEAERCLRDRRHDFDLGILESLDGRRRRLIAETEELKARRNEGSRKVGEAKRSGTDASALMEEIRLTRARHLLRSRSRQTPRRTSSRL